MLRRNNRGVELRLVTKEQIISGVSGGCIAQTAHLHTYPSIPCSRVCEPHPAATGDFRKDRAPMGIASGAAITLSFWLARRLDG